MKAYLACEFAIAMAQRKFPDDVVGMASYCVEWLVSLTPNVSYGSHKYIPVDMLNEKLGLVQGSGIYSYYLFDDGSYILNLCTNVSSEGLVYWSGLEEQSPKIAKI